MTATSSISATPGFQSTESTPKSQFGQLATEERIRGVISALEQNGIHASVVSDGAGAVRAVLDLIPPGSEVLDATSQTLEALGLNEILGDSTRFRNIRGELMRLRQENKGDAMRKLGAAPDVVVGSVHAVTEKGQVVVASASGSQLAPYVFGAGKVVWVVGTQKIVPDLESAFRRVEEYTFPRENERAQKTYGVPSSIAKLLVINREFAPGRIHLVFVQQNLGF